ncbi:MAG: site-specific DNA-methyltransferase [Lysobacter sp.]|nr:site-specific DNA-methyltransferase [Lysobacter sp.]
MPHALTVETRRVEALIPYARNPRTHSDAQVAQIAASIVEFGWTNPILVDGDNGVIAGHGRLLAARKLGMTEVPVIELAHLSAAQKRALVIADNRIAIDAGWDEAMLMLELADLADAGFDLDLTGFSAAEIEHLLDAVESSDDAASTASQVDNPVDNEEGQSDEEAGPVEPQAAPVSRTGDVWRIGAHRLVCGDASDSAVIAALMQGEQAHLCITSPPYARQRDYADGGVGDWDTLMQDVFGAARAALRDSAQVLVNLGLVHDDNEVQPYWDGWIAWMRTSGWRRFGWYVWDQGPGLPGDWRGRLAPSFEFIFHFNRSNRRPNKTVPCKFAGQDIHLRADGTSSTFRGKDGTPLGWAHAHQPTQETRIPDAVIRIMRHKGKLGQGIDHPAVFPVALPSFLIDAYSDAGEVVFEPFAGSGTTLIACERAGRICRAVEIAPAYVDVAIERARQQLPGIAITLEATGRTFEAVAVERRGATRDAA